MHVPLRALFVVDSPVTRVQAVLKRRPELAELVHNDWVRFVVRDPVTGEFYKQQNGLFSLLAAPVPPTNTSVAPTVEDYYAVQVAHGRQVTATENRM